MRLSNATLGRVPSTVERPGYDRAAVTTGVVHFGPGAFFRAHGAAYIDSLLARDPRWGVCAVAPRSRDVRDALAPQDGLYALAVLDEVPSLRVIGALTRVLAAADEPQAVLDALAAPDTRLVTLTITEKGYCLTPGGDLDTAHPDIARDLAGDTRSAIGWLVEGYRLRRATGLPPFTALSCDNLVGNGRRLKRAVVQLAEARDPELSRWIEGEARFPNSMVDSITPATNEALRARVTAELGVADAWPVQREAFTQWVIEDVLGPDAPDLSSVGVTLSSDVAGYEQAKLRLLNGAHSTLAWLGLLRGSATVGEAMRDGALADFVERMMREEIAKALAVPEGLDLGRYIDSILARFANPAIRHELAQISWDSSQKLPYRLLGTVTDALAAGRPVGRLCVAVAGWMRFVVMRARAGERFVDPLYERLAAIGRGAGDGAGDAERFLELAEVFPPALRTHQGFRDAVGRAYARLANPTVLEPEEIGAA